MDNYTLEHVDLTFHYASGRDGFAIHALLEGDGCWYQWGQPRERLSENVEIMDALGND
jgi:hypothetical protein